MQQESLMSRPISASYLERKLRAIVGVMGDNPLPDLTDVNGLLSLEVDRPEWRFAANEFYKSFFVFGAQTAGNLTVVELFNQPGSGVIAVVEQISAWVSGGAANRAVWAWISSPVTVNNTAIARDGREPALSVLQTSVGMGADSSRTVATLLAAPFNLVDADEFGPIQAGGGPYTRPIIIPPGRGIVVYEADTLNARVIGTQITVAMSWYVRSIEGTVEIR
jgi:hypothetical protein